MKIFSVRQTVLPALLVLSPVVFAADEQTMIVSAAPQVVSELDTPAAVSVVDGEEMRLATPRINLSESLTGVPGLQVQNRQNYAQDLQLSIRGFGSRSTYGIRGIRLYVDGIPATMPDGQGQTSNIDLSSVQNVEVLRGPFSALYDAPRDKCTLSCAINGIHAAFHYLKKNYISGCVMTVPTG